MKKQPFHCIFAVDDDVHGTGSFVYRADAMTDRFKMPRLDVELTPKENARITRDKVYGYSYTETVIQDHLKRLVEKYPHMLKENPLLPLEEIIRIYLDKEQDEV